MQKTIQPESVESVPEPQSEPKPDGIPAPVRQSANYVYFDLETTGLGMYMYFV